VKAIGEESQKGIMFEVLSSMVSDLFFENLLQLVLNTLSSLYNIFLIYQEIDLCIRLSYYIYKKIVLNTYAEMSRIIRNKYLLYT